MLFSYVANDLVFQAEPLIAADQTSEAGVLKNIMLSYHEEEIFNTFTLGHVVHKGRGSKVCHNHNSAFIRH